ncbi:MAG: penicillin-binding protein [Actinomycetia bacterium]|nr:penicillin-binding protein [Actinomycetes bacterium]MCP4227746.1 penicillin-binding protein [Actinomycetes bacterium]
MSPRNRRLNPFWRFRRFLFVVGLLVIVGAGAVVYVFSQTELPEDRFDEIAQTSFICTAEVTNNCGPDNASAMLSTGGEDREIITFEDLPENLIQAVVATEDQSFFDHQGIDVRGITRAAYQYVRQMRDETRLVQGGSTITQQYVKLAFDDDDRNLDRKVREAIRAVKLEQELTDLCAAQPDLGFKTPTQCAKEEILTRYLNRAYFGRGASGVQAAARIYFGQDVDDLEVHQSAYLAGLLRNPNGADPESDPQEAARRRATSLERMVIAGYLTLDEATNLNQVAWDDVEPLRPRDGLDILERADFGSEYFVEEVRQQLAELYRGEIYSGGLRVYTTLDPGLQRAAYESAHSPKPENLEERDLPELGPLFLDPNNPDDPAAALVSIDPEGRVVAMLAGSNFEDNEDNLATSSGRAGRQPGSTFKPFGLALAVEQGLSPESIYPAVPGVTRIGGACADSDGPWQVTGGSSARYRYRNLIDATRWSSNIVFAQLVVDIGPNQLRDLAHDMGIGSDLLTEAGATPCSLILGSEGVPVMDMATAYSVFERDGLQLDPVLIDRIEDVDGNVICRFPVDGVCSPEPIREPTRVLSSSTVGQVNYALSQVVSGGTGKRANFDPDWQIAGKTGTSQQNRDGWFAGFTCGLTTVVWMGHGQEETPMIDFRKPLAEGETEPPRDGDGDLIDDRGWPNIEGGNFPSMIWADYMAKATAGNPPCASLNISQEFTGARMNQSLSTTTLPPCGVELDQWGWPRGKGPEDFVLVTTTTTTTTTTAPTTAPPSSQPDGLSTQDDGDDGSTTTTAPCIAIDQWVYQANPDAPRPTDPNPAPTATAQGDGNNGNDQDDG